MEMNSPAAMEKAPASRPAMPVSTMHDGLDGGAGHAHDQTGIGDEAVIDAEDAGAERAAADDCVALSDLLDGGGPGMAFGCWPR